MILSNKQITKGADQTTQASLSLCCSNTEDRFSCVEAHIILSKRANKGDDETTGWFSMQQRCLS